MLIMEGKNVSTAANVPATGIDMATMPLTWRHIRIVIIASMGQFIGQGLACLVGIVIPMVELLAHPQLSAGMQGVLGCTALVGRTIGAVIFGKLSDRYGYLFFFRFCPFLMIVASVTAYFFHELPVLLVCLFFMGFSVGGEYSLDSDYISELMPKKWKIFMVGVAKASSSVGNILVAALCFWLISSWHEAGPWPRLLFIMSGMAGVILLLRIRFSQSPAWLMSKGKKAEAQKALHQLLGDDVSLPSDNAVKPSSNSNVSFIDFFKKNTKKIIFSGVPWACEGLGVYGIGIFLPTLIMALGIDLVSPDASRIVHIVSSVKITIWLSVMMLVGFALGLAVMRRIYHVAMQVWGFVGCTIGLVVLLVAYSLHLPSWLAISGFMIFELFLNAGPHLITFVLPAQIYPVAERGTGDGVAAGIGKAGAVLGAFFIPVLLKWGGCTLALIVSIAVMLVGAVVTYWLGRQVLPASKVHSR